MRFLAMEKAGNPKLAYSGANLARDLKAAYGEEAAACKIVYTASDGSARHLTFEEARARIYDFSFDPHHCPERRWGARGDAELATCPDGAQKRAWYDAQRRLRNQTARAYDVAMSFTLADLRAGVSGSGRNVPPETDVMTVLESAMPGLSVPESILRESVIPENVPPESIPPESGTGVAAAVATP